MSEPRIRRSALTRTLRLIAPDLRPQRGLVVGGTFALLAEVVFRVLEPWPMKIVIDSVLSSLGTATGYAPANLARLVGLGATLIAIVALRALCNYLATVSFALAGSRTAIALRRRAFHHVQTLSQQFHSRNRSADTVQRLVSDVARMQDVAVTAGLPLAANVLTLTVMLGVMVWLDPLLSLVVVGAIALFFFTSSGSSKRITSAARRTRKSEGQLANTAQEALSTIKVVQAYGLEALVEDRFVSANQNSLHAGVRSLRLAAKLERTTDVIVGLGSAVVLIGGGMRVLAGAMTVGDLVLFNTYLRTTMKPLRDMAKYTGRIARAAASGERVANLMDVQPDIVSPPDPVPLGHVRGALTFEDVVTEYDGHEILHGVNLQIDAGEHVAIIGPSGSGKSTLTSLVVRALDPVGGRVRLDGHNLTSLDLSELRAQVSVLHQEAVLFADTIRENIRMGRPEATDAEVEAAARAAGAHDFITSLPDGYDTIVGERGGTLSGGQRQRVAIVRALLRDAPIVVLDEATTGLDPASSTHVLDAVDRLSRGRTLLAVTHETEVAMRSDRVVWVEDGRIALDGPPQQLLEESPAFRAWAAAGAAQRELLTADKRQDAGAENRPDDRPDETNRRTYVRQ
ncbi:ABC transporter ATP-binding protein [Actinomyces sp. MRS3W]|uniref:ABC transporter ATP-binding protein n=1 Tax=Actinomyces sp. MRS3W TaxID=2800796 RepID=UPI0028FD3EB5|nr:ABC transporter ATP-binding protein [Actinomyces sp. MRS3W]MDU0349311.1 ABC transporter ATP-binding protein [Actinomyces sp. MRS3W]